MNRIFPLAVLFGLLKPDSASCQGCSDAGFCTVNGIKIERVNPQPDIHLLKAGTTYGNASHAVHILSPYIDYRINLAGGLYANARLLFSLRSGELASVSGFSDLITSMGFRFANGFGLMGGIKWPFENASRSATGNPLPMAYQITLGTTDLIAAVTYAKSRFSFSFGWQQPIHQNGNAFVNPENPASMDEGAYQTTLGYERKGDMLFRAVYDLPLKSKTSSLSGGLLPIWHLGKDTYLDEMDHRQSIEGSEGLTLNVILIYALQVGRNHFFEFSAGAPAIARKVRPDGLSRMGISLEYAVRL